ncbi:MAG: hypothetical protein U1E65_22830 [Myxococcota bacterium]
MARAWVLVLSLVLGCGSGATVSLGGDARSTKPDAVTADVGPRDLGFVADPDAGAPEPDSGIGDAGLEPSDAGDPVLCTPAKADEPCSLDPSCPATKGCCCGGECVCTADANGGATWRCTGGVNLPDCVEGGATLCIPIGIPFCGP